MDLFKQPRLEKMQPIKFKKIKVSALENKIFRMKWDATVSIKLSVNVIFPIKNKIHSKYNII